MGAQKLMSAVLPKGFTELKRIVWVPPGDPIAGFKLSWLVAGTCFSVDPPMRPYSIGPEPDDDTKANTDPRAEPAATGSTG